MNAEYSNLGIIKSNYKNQLIYYYNQGIGKISEIAGVVISENLIKAIERRYKQIGGKLPIPAEDILERRGERWGFIE